MSLLPFILLALLCFGLAIWLLRMPKSVWALFASALMFGLAGYTLQGEAGLAGSPKQVSEGAAQVNDEGIKVRRIFFDPTIPPSRYVIVADGFTRRGQFADAAGILRASVEKEPEDQEAWLALGNALVDHAQGLVTPAALLAYQRAAEQDPANPAPAYFLGIGYLRSGQLGRARALWADLLVQAEDGSQWQAQLSQQIHRLDQVIAAGNPAAPAAEPGNGAASPQGDTFDEAPNAAPSASRSASPSVPRSTTPSATSSVSPNEPPSVAPSAGQSPAPNSSPSPSL